MLDWGLLLGGGALLYLGAEWLVAGAAGLARRLGVPQLLVGLTVVAYGTSAPELIVSVQGAWSGHGSLAVGNVIGSNIANLGLILGLAVLVRPAPVDGALARREVPMLLASTAALWWALGGGRVERWEAGLLLVGALAYTAWMIHGHLRPREVMEAIADASETEAAAESAGAPTGRTSGQLGLVAAAGLALLLLGGHLFVRGAVGLASAFGLSDRVIGLTVVAIGTSVPELAASVIAALRGHSGIAIGNVVGSNIFNVLLCLGCAGLTRPLVLSDGYPHLDLTVLSGLTLLAALGFRRARTCGRLEGALFLVVYLVFLGSVAWAR